MGLLWWLLLAGAVVSLLIAINVEGASSKEQRTLSDTASLTPASEFESMDASAYKDSHSDEDDLNIDALSRTRMLSDVQDDQEAHNSQLVQNKKQENDEVQKRGAEQRNYRAFNKWLRIGKRLHSIHEKVNQMLLDSNTENNIDKRGRSAKYVRIGRNRQAKFVRIGRSTSTDDDLRKNDMNSADKRLRASAKFVRIGRKR